MPAERRSDVAHGLPGAGLQDHRGFPQGQWPCHPCREFIVVCGRAGLLTATTVAIDGSKFKAVKRLEQIEASIERYMSELETADRQPSTPEIKRTRLKGKIDRLKQEIERVKAIEAQLASAKDTQISLTDPDARSMQSMRRLQRA